MISSMQGTTYWVYVRTSLHVGAGRGTGFIDLPIMRERVTNWPMVPGSSVKGVLRDRHNSDHPSFVTAFGHSVTDGETQAGALLFTDANIVCLPVKSMYGTFAYVTSPLVLARLKRDADVLLSGGRLEVPDGPADDAAFCADDAVFSGGSAGDDKLYLEDLDFQLQKNAQAGLWAEYIGNAVFQKDNEWRRIFTQRFVILSDQMFNFLSEYATEVNARIKVDDEKGTVKNGALWYEENLPTETILSGMVWCDRVVGSGVSVEELLNMYCRDPLNVQMGGHASTGHGRVECLFGRREE